jgi:hypothetical protein
MFSFIFSLHQTYNSRYKLYTNTHTKIVTIGTGYFDSNAFYDPDYNYNQDVVRNAARMRQNQKQTQQLPQNPQQQQMQQMQQQKMMGGPNGPKPMDKTMGNMQQMQNLPGQQQNKQNQMVIIAFVP